MKLNPRALNQEVSIKTVLITLLCGYLAALSLGFVFLGTNSLFDGTTALLGLGIGLVVLIPLKFFGGDLFAQLAMLVVMFLLFVCPGLLGYLFTPSLVVFPFGEEIGSREINFGLWYLLLGTFLMIVGFLTAEVALRRYVSTSAGVSTTPMMYPTGVMLTIFLLAIAGDWFITWSSGVSLFGKLRAETGNVQIQLLKGLFGVDTSYFMILTLLLLRKAKGGAGSGYGMIVFVTISYIFYMAFNGSRGTALRVMFMLMAILVCTRGNFRATLGHYCSVILFLSVVGLSLYPLATQIRINESTEFNKTTDQIAPSERTKHGTDLYSHPQRLLANIANRLAGNIVNYTVVVLSQLGDLDAKARYMNVEYAIKNIINYCVPGSMFPEAELGTSRVMAIIYRGFTEEYVRSHGYFSEIWTAWGLSYVLFAWWGGLFSLFVAGFVIHAGYVFMLQSSGKFSSYLVSWYLFLVPPLFYASGGLDHYMTTVLVYFLQAGVILFVYFLAVSSFRRVGRYWPLHIRLSR